MNPVPSLSLRHGERGGWVDGSKGTGSFCADTLRPFSRNARVANQFRLTALGLQEETPIAATFLQRTTRADARQASGFRHQCLRGHRKPYDGWFRIYRIPKVP